MSIQVKCNGCDEVIDTSSHAWFEAAFFDPSGEESDEEDGSVMTQTVYHLCSAACVSVWGARMSMEKWSGPVL
jgi:hypothetical protein